MGLLYKSLLHIRRASLKITLLFFKVLRKTHCKQGIILGLEPNLTSWHICPLASEGKLWSPCQISLQMGRPLQQRICLWVAVFKLNTTVHLLDELEWYSQENGKHPGICLSF